MGHGSLIVYSVQPVSLGRCSVMQARRMASISPCQVGSWLASTRFIPSATILLSLTITAPYGAPVPYSKPARAAQLNGPTQELFVIGV
jgi:hypothetical protein